MQYLVLGAVLLFLGCGSTPCALSEPALEVTSACSDCAAALPNLEKKQQTAPASREAPIQADRQSAARSQTGFIAFASTPDCIGPCKPSEIAYGGDLLSDPAEDLRAWGLPEKNGVTNTAFLGRTRRNAPAPGANSLWRDPKQEEPYWVIGELAFSGAETNFRTLSAGIKWVKPLKLK